MTETFTEVMVVPEYGSSGILGWKVIRLNNDVAYDVALFYNTYAPGGREPDARAQANLFAGQLRAGSL